MLKCEVWNGAKWIGNDKRFDTEYDAKQYMKQLYAEDLSFVVYRIIPVENEQAASA